MFSLAYQKNHKKGEMVRLTLSKGSKISNSKGHELAHYIYLCTQCTNQSVKMTSCDFMVGYVLDYFLFCFLNKGE